MVATIEFFCGIIAKASMPVAAEPGLEGREDSPLRGAGWTASNILYSAGIRGTEVGFWKSTDGGVSLTNYRAAPGGDGRDF
jgi:hypothetical protein